MLRFYNYELNEKAKEYIEKIKNDSKKLDKENQKFIEDIFLEEKDELHYGYGIYLKDTIKEKFSSKKDVKFNDIFPKNVYPAMELLVGKKFLKIFLEK